MRNSGSRASLPAFVLLAVQAIFGGLGLAQSSAGPQPAPLPPPIQAPVDKPYGGVLTLSVDLANVNARILTVHETIPVKPGALTLLYPEWLPGTHSPSNLAARLAGLVITADGKRVPWTRDRVSMSAFHVEVPKGATSLELNFQYLAPINPQQGRISNKFANVTWNSVLLYPAGYFSRQIPFAAELRLPDGWKFATSLDVKSQNGNTVQFKETPLNTLIDSPVYAGANFARVDISSGPDNPVFLDVFADKPEQLKISDEELFYHKALVVQAQRLFRSKHYDHYDFLFSLSDSVGGKGLEHHQSSEDGTRGNYFTDWGAETPTKALLPHEYVHSWNGKFRRPADLWTPNFNVPMQNDLLWVYEGLTNYYGEVLAARSALWSQEDARDLLAMTAASFEAAPGRSWRSLEDTTTQPILSSHGGVPFQWGSWQRGADYYPESNLVWLDADTKIRELSGGKKSLDDFARVFFGVNDGSTVVVTYTLEDVVKALNSVQAYDWDGFFRTRVYEVEPQVPLDGITRGGWKLVYNDEEPGWMKHPDPMRGASFAFSLGFSVKPEGGGGDKGAAATVASVWWDSPAFKAGITPDMQIQAVNDRAYSAVNLKAAIVASEKGSEPVKLLMKRDDELFTVNLDYHGGLRYPHLERVESVPDRLGAVLSPVD